MEQQRMDMELLLKQQCQEIEMQMDQQRKDMANFTEMSMSSIISQVP
jgi:hypothetical protein